MAEKTKYTYAGPVERYGKCVSVHWEASTFAANPEAARRNLQFRFNTEGGFLAYLPVTFPAEIREEAV